MQMVLKAQSQREETGEEEESEPPVPVIIHFKQSVLAWIRAILFSMKPDDVFKSFKNSHNEIFCNK